MKKLLGVILLIGGIVVGVFGFLYMNSPQYKMMSLVNSVTGASDPTGTVAIIIGALLAIVGAGLLITGGSANNNGNKTAL